MFINHHCSSVASLSFIHPLYLLQNWISSRYIYTSLETRLSNHDANVRFNIEESMGTKTTFLLSLFLPSSNFNFHRRRASGHGWEEILLVSLDLLRFPIFPQVSYCVVVCILSLSSLLYQQQTFVCLYPSILTLQHFPASVIIFFALVNVASEDSYNPHFLF